MCHLLSIDFNSMDVYHELYVAEIFEIVWKIIDRNRLVFRLIE